MPLSQLAHAR